MSEPLKVDPYGVVVDYYDQWARHMTDDVPFYVQECTRAPGPVVELGVGMGRVAIPVAQAGQSVIGVDVSAAMLTEGRRRAAAAGVAERIRWVQADMREWIASPPVSLVTIPFRSFLHMTTTEDQLGALARANASLVAGGHLICNMFIPDPAVVADYEGKRRLQADYVDEHGRHCELWGINRYGTADQRLTVTTILEVYEGGRVVDTVESDLHLRMVYRYEMEHLLVRSGFEVEALYGGFDRRPMTEDANEMIWIARKR